MHVDVLESIGRYEIVGELGSGSMSRVFLANDPNLDRKVAVKVVLQGFSLDNKEQSELERRFLLEARAAGKLSHRGIVRVYDADTDPTLGIPYIAMEWVQGRSLRNLLDEGGRLDGPRTLDILSQVALALDYAHRAGRIHRDIKPSNILISKGGTAKVSDFGVAKIVSETHTVSGQILGTPAYMSPEQVKDEPLDGRSDLFSLGAVLYQCVSGATPFGGESLVQVVYKILNVDPRPLNLDSTPALEALAAVVNLSLQKDPNQRFQSGSEFAEALDQIQTAMSNEPGVDFRWQRTLHKVPAVSDTIPTVDAALLKARIATGQTNTVQLSTTSIHRATAREPGNTEQRAGSHETVVTAATVAPDSTRGWRTSAVTLALTGLLVVMIAAVLNRLSHDSEEPRSMALVHQTATAYSEQTPTESTLVFPEQPDPEPTPPQTRSERPSSEKLSLAESTPPPVQDKAESRPVSERAGVIAEPASEATVPDRSLPQMALTPVTILYRHKGGLAFLSVALDGQRVWGQELKPVEGRLQKLTGYEARAVVPVPGGTHTLQVNLTDPDRQVETSNSIRSRYTNGTRRMLRVSVDPKNNALRLRWKE